MIEKVNAALSIINDFDWHWRMEDSNYKRNMIEAQNQSRKFLGILKEIRDKEVVSSLRKLWIANYDMSLPYMENSYYIKKKEELASALLAVQEVTGVFTI